MRRGVCDDAGLQPTAERDRSMSIAPQTPLTANPPKRRARMACSFCQSRKIRCNVEESLPCSQCVMEKVDCRITKTRRSKRARLTSTTDVEGQEVLQHVPATTLPRMEDGAGSGNDMPDPSNSVHEFGTTIAQSTESAQDAGHSLVPASHIQPQSYPSLPLTPSIGSCSLPRDTRDDILEPHSSDLTLPDYLKPVPKFLRPESIDYLQRMGCFEIPAPKFRDDLLRSYSDYFHPTMPVLDLIDFINIVQTPGQGRGISLFLFQAVMFAGSSHCDIKFLRGLGFLTRKAARRALYLKTKALYEMEYERNRLCVIQVLAIMTYWYDTPDDQKDSTHWLVVALSLARREGLDQNMLNANVSEYQRRMSRRIWWSCVSRDAQCALGLKGPLALQVLDPEIATLALEDFDISDAPDESYNMLGNWPPLKIRLLRLICVAQCTLQVHLRSIFARQYRLGAHSRRSADSSGKTSKTVLLPVTSQITRNSVEDIDNSLRTWRNSLPHELQGTAVTADISDSKFESFVVARSFLHMLYYTCFITLYRPWLRPMPQNNASQAETTLPDKAQKIVHESAHKITDIVVDLHRLDLARYLPQIGLASLLAAAVSHACDIVSPSEHLRRSGGRGLEHCTHVVNELRDNFYSADFCFDFCKVLLHAKRLTESSKPEMASREWIGDGFDEQISRLSATSCFPLPSRPPSPTSDRLGNVSKRAENRPAPGGLSAQQPHVMANVESTAGAPLWNFDTGDNPLVGEQQASNPFDANIYFNYYGNFREDSTTLLGHLYDDFQPGWFDSLGLDTNMNQ